ncbi:hypothetical protein J4450_05265 [Candidatus Micrarchaeota archaeon]|nr:hypothetical protein [Candidatus Micrarchaeota archaeon]
MPRLQFQKDGSIRKDPSACAIFGAIAIQGGKGFVAATQAKDAIELVRDARGGTMGNGILLSHPDSLQNGNGYYNIEVLAEDQDLFERAAYLLGAYPDITRAGPWEKLHNTEGRGIWCAPFAADDLRITRAVVELNGQFSPDQLRLISSGKHEILVKDLDSLTDLFVRYQLAKIMAKAILAHARYPTGAWPLPSRAHPHCFGNVGMVFNGDVKSYIANRRRAEAIIAEHLYPLLGSDEALENFIPIIRRSWVGSDAEVIAAPFYFLLRASLSIPSVVSTLVPPFDNTLATLPRGMERDRMRKLLTTYSGMQLDGPVSSIVLVTTDKDVQMLAFRDRNEFRPLRIMFDREDGIVYAASEDRQLEIASGKSVRDPKVESYSLDSGQFLWVSSREGIIAPGRTRRTAIVVPAPPKPNGRSVFNTRGEPHMFAGDRDDTDKVLDGLAGNCTGAYSMGDESTYEIFSSAQANAFESSRARGVIVHGNVDMMTPNAFQGGFFYVRGSGDSRFGQQLRHSQKHAQPPVALAGERIGTYGFKMIAGGIGAVLGISEIGHEEEMQPLVGRFLATGMMSGTVYVRGNVPREYIGRSPSARRIKAEIKELAREGLITSSQAGVLFENALDLQVIEEELANNEPARRRISALFYPPHQKPYDVQFRELDSSDAFLLGNITKFCERFGLEPSILAALESSSWTVVRLKEDVITSH